ncbi:MAG TPA: ABC transporter permease [Thermoanaerobaculia bacterium]|jgi:putative ABC transport system permease protein|nr:ABC transporter permease [Thermoanaerobaculia bacterium]
MYFRLLGESLRRGTRRKLLAVTAIALGTLGASALAEVLLASGDRLAAELGAYGANLEIVSAPGGRLVASDLVKLRKIFWRNNIVAVAPLFEVRVRMAKTNPVEEIVAPLVGTWFDHSVDAEFRTGLPKVRTTLRIVGRWPAEEVSGAPEIALGRRLAARLGATEGMPIRAELGGRSAIFRVVGRVESGGDEEEQAFVPLAAANALAAPDAPRDRVARAEVFAMTTPEEQNRKDPARMTGAEYDAWYCTAYPSSIALQIGEALPNTRASIVRGITDATAEILGRLRTVLFALAFVALLGGAVGASAAMTATVLERRLEAGLLTALGAPRRRVVLFFLSEAALLGVLGGLLGGAVGLAAGRWVGSGALGVAVPWAPVLLPWAMLLGLLLAVCASVLPVFRALDRYPAAMLKKATA